MLWASSNVVCWHLWWWSAAANLVSSTLLVGELLR
jgi:hypothetical protein